MSVVSTLDRLQYLFYKSVRDTSALDIKVFAFKTEASKKETALPEMVDITDTGDDGDLVYLGAAAGVEKSVGIDLTKLETVPGTYYIQIVAGYDSANQHVVARAEIDVNGKDGFTVRT